MDKNTFKLSIYKNALLPPSDPSYFDNRFSLNINNYSGFAEVGRNGYTLNEKIIQKIAKYITKNLDLLDSLAKLSNFDMIIGGGSSEINLNYGGSEFVIKLQNNRQSDKIIKDITKLIQKAIKKGEAFTDETSPNPVLDAQEWEKKFEEENGK